MLTIKEIVQQLSNDGEWFENDRVKVCKVVSVDGFSCVVDPIDGDTRIEDVRLIADETDEFFVLIPKVESIVVVSFLTQNSAYVSMVSEVIEVKYKIGTALYSMTEAGFLLQKGNDTLKQAIILVIEAVQQIVVMQGNNPNYAKLTQALNKINNLLR